jgi:hypothetical protein
MPADTQGRGRSVHPPAGAASVIAVVNRPTLNNGWLYVLFPALCSSLVLLIIAYIFNNLYKGQKCVRTLPSAASACAFECGRTHAGTVGLQIHISAGRLSATCAPHGRSIVRSDGPPSGGASRRLCHRRRPVAAQCQWGMLRPCRQPATFRAPLKPCSPPTANAQSSTR